jgi:hypothetical protein
VTIKPASHRMSFSIEMLCQISRREMRATRDQRRMCLPVAPAAISKKAFAIREIAQHVRRSSSAMLVSGLRVIRPKRFPLPEARLN